MAHLDRLSGNEAVAVAMRQIDPDVMGAFPITPSTEIPQYFAQYVADGLVHTELVTVESEHSSMSVCMGAAAAGAGEETEAAAEAFGMALGMAFQCRDDMLDGDGFCALLGEEKCAALTAMYTEKALELLDAFPDAGFLRELTARLSGRSV